MSSLSESVIEYKKQLGKGDIKAAYVGLMEYIMKLRGYFAAKYPDYLVSGSIYYGYMDMTYFAFTPETLKDKKLKIAIVFIHDSTSFEVWLAGSNKQIQTKYWELIKDSGWSKYRIPANIEGIDSIVEGVLVDKPDFDDLDEVTRQIENGTLKFIEEIEAFLLENQI